MYYDKLERERNARYFDRKVEIISTTEIKQVKTVIEGIEKLSIQKIVTYKPSDGLYFNIYISSITVIYDTNNKTRAWYTDAKGEKHEIVLSQFFRIMDGDTPNIKVTKDGYIIAFNKEELIVFFDFSDNYQFIYIEELTEIGRFSGKLEDVEGNEFIFVDEYYKNKMRIPFTINTKLLHNGFPIYLEIEEKGY